MTNDLSRQRPAWSDQDLDAALGHLQAAASEHTRTDGLVGTRSVVMQAAAATVDEPLGVVAANGSRRAVRGPRRAGSLWIAAAIALLVGGGLLIPSLTWGARSVNTAVAIELNQAADAAARVAAAGGGVTPPGAYQYIDVVGWSAQMGGISFLQQSRQQIWVPADWRDTWLERRSTTGERQWIYGTEDQAVAAGLPKDNVPSTEPDFTGPCAEYFTNLCDSEGSWQAPTQAWIDGLPTNPDDLYDRLYDDSEGRGQSQESEMLVQATDALRTGLLPPAVRSTLYRAMAKIRGVQMSTSTNLAGTTGVGFSVDSPYLRDETIIDPTSGDFIGTRTTTIVDDPINHLPAGTVISSTAVTTQIVPTLGATGP